MTDTLKVLGQVNPLGSTLTDAYTAPAAAAVSSVVVCNQATYTIKFRISVAVAGAADDPKQYLYYDVEVDANDTFVAVIGVTLATTGVIRVYANSGQVSFNIFGVEVS